MKVLHERHDPTSTFKSAAVVATQSTMHVFCVE